MTLKQLDVVILDRDLPDRNLAAGDLGTIVEVYGLDSVEVEFVRASGQTQALVELDATDVRPVGEDDLLAVRKVDRVA
jgi:hypothetical protein